MKHRMIFLTLSLVAYLFSCEPTILFTDPQPIGVQPTYSFDERYQGVFYCSSDSAWVVVSPNSLYKEKTFSFIVDKEELDSSELNKSFGDRIFLEEVEAHADVSYADDSVYLCTLDLRDTLFTVDTDHVLKSYRGSYILNTRLADTNWDVKILSLDASGNLSLKKTTIPEDLAKLEKITPVKDISTERREQLLISPTKIEFKKLMKAELIFEECDYFERVVRRLPM